MILVDNVIHCLRFSGDSYTLVKANDLLRQSVTLKSNHEGDITIFSVSQVLEDIDKKTHSEYKYIEHYHAEFSYLGKTIFAI